MGIQTGKAQWVIWEKLGGMLFFLLCYRLFYWMLEGQVVEQLLLAYNSFQLDTDIIYV